MNRTSWWLSFQSPLKQKSVDCFNKLRCRPIRSLLRPRVAELVGLVSGRRLACFSESCGPLPDLGVAAPSITFNRSTGATSDEMKFTLTQRASATKNRHDKNCYRSRFKKPLDECSALDQCWGGCAHNSARQGHCQIKSGNRTNRTGGEFGIQSRSDSGSFPGCGFER